MTQTPPPKLKIEPARGSLPVLQWLQPSQLQVDPSYQRSIEASSSVRLISAIAKRWNWDLCQPLVVSRRPNGEMFVVDGQHRLEAAKARGDIGQLPCVIANFDTSAQEAASFVEFNQARRPLTAQDLFRSAVASGDKEALSIMAALDQVGMTIASGRNNQHMATNAIGAVSTLRRVHANHGQYVLIVALDVLQQGFKDQVLRYAGSLLDGIAAVIRDTMKAEDLSASGFQDGDLFILLTEMLGGAAQGEWYVEIATERARSGCNTTAASEIVIRKAWLECRAEAESDD